MIPPSPASDPEVAATLGDLTFDLGSEELRARTEARLQRAQSSLDTLIGSPGPRTVQNLLEPLNALLMGVRDVGSHGSLVFSVHTDPATRTAGREASEAADRFFHAFRLNTQAYAALREVDLSTEEPTTRFAVEKLLREMRRAGVELDPPTRERLLRLNEEIDLSANRFSENIANQERSIELSSPAELSGLPEDYLAAHPPTDGGRILITTRYPDFGPVMAYAERADVRRRLLHEFANRAYPDNLPVLAELLARRNEFAGLLGYPSYAAFAAEDKMLRTPEEIRGLLDRLARVLGAPAREGLTMLLERKRRDEPAATRVEPWEAAFFGPGYYDQKIRTESFGVDMRRLRRYLPYGRVRDGLLELCRQLFALEFVRVEAPAWHPTVEVYDVTRAGLPLGRVYFDLTPRDGKYSHAACFTVREGVRGVQLPQAALICNFLIPGAPAETCRIEYGQVVTFFHEFGHLVHSLLSGHQRWLYNGQSNLEWDFVEAPSQLFEEWARDPATLARFARDPETGEAAPAELLARLKESASFLRALSWLRQLAFAAISLDLYSSDPAGWDLSAEAQRAYARYALTPMPDDYHFVAAFGHLTGYASFYYTYAWSAVIARDLLSPFLDRGTLTDPTIAARYAREILAPGSERPAADLIRSYLGRPFSYDAFERWVSEPAGPPPKAA